jgi:hypothetical protein
MIRLCALVGRRNAAARKKKAGFPCKALNARLPVAYGIRGLPIRHRGIAVLTRRAMRARSMIAAVVIASLPSSAKAQSDQEPHVRVLQRLAEIEKTQRHTVGGVVIATGVAVAALGGVLLIDRQEANDTRNFAAGMMIAGGAGLAFGSLFPLLGRGPHEKLAAAAATAPREKVEAMWREKAEEAASMRKFSGWLNVGIGAFAVGFGGVWLFTGGRERESTAGFAGALVGIGAFNLILGSSVLTTRTPVETSYEIYRATQPSAAPSVSVTPVIFPLPRGGGAGFAVSL